MDYSKYINAKRSSFGDQISMMSKIIQKRLMGYTICKHCKQRAAIYSIEYDNPIFNRQEIICTVCEK